MESVVFELCAENLAACLAGREGGARRVELCSALSEGGLTPSHALIEAAVVHSGLPINILLRPRAGNFVYSDQEFSLMQSDLHHARTLGASGFVAGIVDSNGKIDQRRMGQLVQLAGDLEVTFHRAFDTLDDMDDALEQIIDSGCRRLLTSGGAVDVETGADRLRSLSDRAADRIVIAARGLCGCQKWPHKLPWVGAPRRPWQYVFQLVRHGDDSRCGGCPRDDRGTV